MEFSYEDSPRLKYKNSIDSAGSTPGIEFKNVIIPKNLHRISKPKAIMKEDPNDNFDSSFSISFGSDEMFNDSSLSDVGHSNESLEISKMFYNTSEKIDIKEAPRCKNPGLTRNCSLQSDSNSLLSQDKPLFTFNF